MNNIVGFTKKYKKNCQGSRNLIPEHTSTQNNHSKENTHPYVRRNTLWIAMTRRQPRSLPTGEQISRWGTHTTGRWILFSHNREWNYAMCSNMDGPRDYHTKWKKLEKERQIPYGTTYLTQMSSSTKHKTSKRYKEETCGCQGGNDKEGMDRQFGINIYRENV